MEIDDTIPKPEGSLLPSNSASGTGFPFVNRFNVSSFSKANNQTNPYQINPLLANPMITKVDQDQRAFEENKNIVADIQNSLDNATVSKNTSQPSYTINLEENPSLEKSHTQKLKDIANPYFASQYGLGLATLASNVLQDPPPGRYSKQVYLDRQDIDTKPYDTAKENVRDASRRSFRNMREGLSQASELMRGVQAVTVSEQKQLANIEAQKAQAINQNNAVNNQIQHKQDIYNAQKRDEDSKFNWQAQRQFKLERGQAITGSLKMLSETAGNQARYEMDEVYRQKQEEVQQEHIKRQGQIDLMALKLKSSTGWNESEHYQSELRKEKLKFFDTVKEEMKEKYGDDFVVEDKEIKPLEERLTQARAYQNSLTKKLEEVPTKPIRPEVFESDEAEQAYNKALKEYETSLSQWNELEQKVQKGEENLNAFEKRVNKRRESQKEYIEKLRNANVEANFAQEYKQKYGYYTLADFPELDSLLTED